jgi:hypothetical protein
MKPPIIEIPYNGQSFFIDIADGNMVSLNRIYEISGSPKNQDPSQWIRLEATKKVIESLNMDETHILKTKRGIGGGTVTHWQLALSYAQYLSPELHLVVNRVFKERLEESIDPELGIDRSLERSISKWRSQGHDEKWIADRIHNANNRTVYVDTLLNHDVKPNHELGICTNQIYQGIFGKDKNGIEKEIRDKAPGLPKNINIRDHAKRSSIAAIGLAEALAAEDIETLDIRGVAKCAEVSFDKGFAVQGALSESRSKSQKKPLGKTVTAENSANKLQALKDALKPK